MSDYTLKKPEPEHCCHWPGCHVQVPPKYWGCRTHWYMLPESFRNMIWATYRPGQEVDKNPGREYINVVKMVQVWIIENHFKNK